MAGMIRVPLGQLLPGDEVFDRVGRSFKSAGVVKSTAKNVEGRYITVTFEDGHGFSQNWAAKVLVKRGERNAQ